MKLSSYWRTVGLNYLFILLLPLLLSIFTDSMVAFFIYLVLYSVLEHILDVIHYPKSGTDRVTLAIIVTVLFNFLLLYGISVILQFFLLSGMIVIFSLFTLWILLLSKVELIIDEKLIIKKG